MHTQQASHIVQWHIVRSYSTAVSSEWHGGVVASRRFPYIDMEYPCRQASRQAGSSRTTPTTAVRYQLYTHERANRLTYPHRGEMRVTDCSESRHRRHRNHSPNGVRSKRHHLSGWYLALAHAPPTGAKRMTGGSHRLTHARATQRFHSIVARL